MGRSKNTQPKRNAQFTVTEQRTGSANHAQTTEDSSKKANVTAKKRVTFAPVLEHVIPVEEPKPEEKLAETNKVPAETTPATEVEVEMDSARLDGQARWTVRLLEGQVSQQDDVEKSRKWLLQRYRLENSTLLVVSNQSISEISPTSGGHGPEYCVQSLQGVTCLLEHCESSYCINQEEGGSAIDDDGFRSLASAVQDGTIMLTCKSLSECSMEISLRLTRRAFEVSCPAQVPIHARRSRLSKRQRPNQNLRLALAALFPHSVLSDVIKNPRDKQNDAITAKMVYDVTDNVQLLASSSPSDNNQDDTMDIPGLVPKLRPYQAEAVKWMLQREKCSFTKRGSPRQINGNDNDGREWEMAWIVLKNPDNDTSDTASQTNGSCKETSTVLPLYEYNCDPPTESTDLLLCSPFTGWLSTSYKEAHAFSVQSVLPSWNPETDSHPHISGGILADSMGLGKTVEVLACILANQMYPKKKHVVRKLDFSGATDADSEEKKQEEESLREALLVDEAALKDRGTIDGDCKPPARFMSTAKEAEDQGSIKPQYNGYMTPPRIGHQIDHESEKASVCGSLENTIARTVTPETSIVSNAKQDESSERRRMNGGNVDYCSVCRKRKGDMFHCRRCPRSFHLDCINRTGLVPKEWVCHVCTEEQSGLTEDFVDGMVSFDTIQSAYACFSEYLDFTASVQVLSMIHEMVTKLMDYEFGDIFRHPVDCMAVNGYKEVVKEPMDLGTISTKLTSGTYGKDLKINGSWNDVLLAVLRDVELVWHNCFIFNREGSMEYRAAELLRQRSLSIQKRSFDHLLNDCVKRRLEEYVSECTQRRQDDVKLSILPQFNKETNYVPEDCTGVDNAQSLGECFCGGSLKTRSSLSVVVCRTCLEPMHGVCAGFDSQEQLVLETEVMSQVVFSSGGRKLFCRVCNYDRCPCCVAGKCGVFSEGERNLINSRATLIVTPPSILNQWQREIERHTVNPLGHPGRGSSPWSDLSLRASSASRPLKVVVYPGIRELCHKSGYSDRRRSAADKSDDCRAIHLIHPRILADADVVLMTFQALMGDLGHSSDNPYVRDASDAASNDRVRRSNLRKRKRYRVIPSPLTSIKWWRVCLDEAQRVEAPTAASAKMALKLDAVHRWCVSGTPVGKGKIEDLYGLVLFLGLVPFASKPFFIQCLQSSHRGVMDRVNFLLKTVFWRSTKACARVRDEMGVPEQVEKKELLRLSSVERHFYDRQLEETLLAANAVVGANGKKHKASQVNAISLHLHRLRAACCHPQVGTRGIGLQKRKRKKNTEHLSGSSSSACESSGVLSMEQILDRLIDDAKTKCEEAQRLAVMHTNALACLSKLKVEARRRGCTFSDSDESFLTCSCENYLESLELTDSNAKPSAIVGEATINGCTGFRSPRKVIRDGRAMLDWQVKEHDSDGRFTQFGSNVRQVWARIDFEGPSKKIVEIMIRPIQKVPPVLAEDRLSGPVWCVLRPKDCILQVSNSSVGGEFVDVMAFTLSDATQKDAEDNDWETFGGFRTNKSKSWRIVVKNYYCNKSEGSLSSSLQAFYVGMDVQLMEADIAQDSLQRLHVLHNASLSLASLLQQQEEPGSPGPGANGTYFINGGMSATDIRQKALWMNSETQKIESLYMDAARTIHRESQRQLQNASNARKQLENDLQDITQRVRKSKTQSNATTCFWDDLWWDDLLSACYLHATPSERMSLCDKVASELNDFYADTVVGRASKKRFPQFEDAGGLKVALSMYMEEILSHSGARSHASCIESVTKLLPHPSEAEVLENRHCGTCRKDWNQTGPKCRHCELDGSLEKLENDPVLSCVLSALWRWAKDLKASGALRAVRIAARIDDRAKKFFEVVKAADKERLVARVAWRTHFDLLSDIDELNQCKQTMRLAQEGEDLSKLTEEEQNFIVSPWDISARIADHAAKQAMGLANVRRNKDTLRYLKNQSVERSEELMNRDQRQNGQIDNETGKKSCCVVCLAAFEGERAVLACGHYFHTSCIEALMRRSGNHNSISCPMRCQLRTRRDQVLFATDKRKDDGSKCAREVKGSWGTKVTRLVSDVMDVSELGEKSIVFSQWEDMLEVVEHALTRNGVRYVRVKSLASIGDSLKQFRSQDCMVLLLNVKNGAEGLTLVEATHVFMVEPLLNCGLDSQAINRIHRIGQSCRTYVHRYLVQDTIEIKIDKMRMDRQGDQLEDAIHDTKKKHAIGAGGIDGGLSQSELEEVLR